MRISDLAFGPDWDMLELRDEISICQEALFAVCHTFQVAKKACLANVAVPLSKALLRSNFRHRAGQALAPSGLCYSQQFITLERCHTCLRTPTSYQINVANGRTLRVWSPGN